MLMKYHEVRSDASAVDEIMGVGSLPAGTWFTVHQRLEKARQQIWYQVVAEGYMGWINGVALTAQVLPVLAPPVAAGDILPMLKTILRFPDEAKAGCYDEAPEDIADCVNTVVDSYESLIVGFARAAYDRDLASIAAVAVVRCGGAAGDLEGLQFAAEWDVLDWVNRCAIREYRKNIKPLGGEQAVIEVKKK